MTTILIIEDEAFSRENLEDILALEVYYQPQFDIQTGQLVGAESLMRWQHPSRGFVSPAHVIPIAETLGLIVPMGEWILCTACQQVQRWPQYPALPFQPHFRKDEGQLP